MLRLVHAIQNRRQPLGYEYFYGADSLRVGSILYHPDASALVDCILRESEEVLDDHIEKGGPASELLDDSLLGLEPTATPAKNFFERVTPGIHVETYSGFVGHPWDVSAV
jgi:hypothetical protein